MAGQTLHGDISSMALDDTLADREAKSGAKGFFGALVCGLGEFLENPFMLFQGNAGAIVSHIIQSPLRVMMTGFSATLQVSLLILRMRAGRSITGTRE
jgi:hypothetical protein